MTSIPRTSPRIPWPDRIKKDTTPSPDTSPPPSLLPVGIGLTSFKEIPMLDCFQDQLYLNLWWDGCSGDKASVVLKIPGDSNVQLRLITSIQHGDPHKPGDVQTPHPWLDFSSIWMRAEPSNMAAPSHSWLLRLETWLV